MTEGGVVELDCDGVRIDLESVSVCLKHSTAIARDLCAFGDLLLKRDKLSAEIKVAARRVAGAIYLDRTQAAAAASAAAAAADAKAALAESDAKLRTVEKFIENQVTMASVPIQSKSVLRICLFDLL